MCCDLIDYKCVVNQYNRFPTNHLLLKPPCKLNFKTMRLVRHLVYIKLVKTSKSFLDML